MYSSLILECLYLSKDGSLGTEEVISITGSVESANTGLDVLEAAGLIDSYKDEIKKKSHWEIG